MAKSGLVVSINTQDHGDLYLTIERKRKKLLRLNRRYEKLNEQIGSIQKEYEERIGSLFRKSTILDIQIERYKTINRLVEKGLSKEEAVRAIEEEEARRGAGEHEWAFFDTFEEPLQPEGKNQEFLRKLWIKLVQKYHPDLAKDYTDKKKREHIMKVINYAYSKKDFKALQTIDQQELIEKKPVMHAENRQQTLIDLENALIRLDQDLLELKKSEWYRWRKKSKDQRNQLFADLERNLVREVLQKEFILNRLKNKQKQF